MKKERSALRDLLLYLPAKVVMDFTAAVPRALGYALAKGLAFVLWKLAGVRKKVMYDNFRYALPELPEERYEEVGYRIWLYTLYTYTEFCWFPRMKRENLHAYARVKGEENIRNAYNKGKGVMLVNMHQYSGEFLAATLPLIGLPAHWVIREVDNRYLDKRMDDFRTSTGLHIIKKEKAMQKMIKVLRDKEVLAFTADQKASLNGIWVKFMGRWSASHKTAAVMHLRTGAPIIPAFTVPDDGDSLHTIHFLPEVRYTPTGDQKRDVFAITQMIAELQTAFIRKHPELWFWIHRRWSITPSGEELPALEEQYRAWAVPPDLSGIK